MSQLNWYPFRFANKFVNSESNSINFYNSLEWSIVEFFWKFNRVLSTGSKVMLVQIWTNKFWTFQHVKDTLITINYDVISVAKYQQARTGPAGYREIPGGPVGWWAGGQQNYYDIIFWWPLILSIIKNRIVHRELLWPNVTDKKPNNRKS